MKSFGHFFGPNVQSALCVHMACWNFTCPLWECLDVDVLLMNFISIQLNIIYMWH